MRRLPENGQLRVKIRNRTKPIKPASDPAVSTCDHIFFVPNIKVNAMLMVAPPIRSAHKREGNFDSLLNNRDLLIPPNSFRRVMDSL